MTVQGWWHPVADGTVLLRCPACAAVVADRRAHERWHEAEDCQTRLRVLAGELQDAPQTRSEAVSRDFGPPQDAEARSERAESCGCIRRTDSDGFKLLCSRHLSHQGDAVKY